MESSATENTARFIEMEAEWHHFQENLFPFDRVDQWERQTKSLFETAKKFEGYILSLRPDRVTSLRLPSWNKELSELKIGDEVVRRVRPTAKNLVLILDVFQEDNWRIRVESPFPPDEDGKQKRREAIRELNKRLEQIQFESDGSGEAIVWKWRQ